MERPDDPPVSISGRDLRWDPTNRQVAAVNDECYSRCTGSALPPPDILRLLSTMLFLQPGPSWTRSTGKAAPEELRASQLSLITQPVALTGKALRIFPLAALDSAVTFSPESNVPDTSRRVSILGRLSHLRV